MPREVLETVKSSLDEYVMTATGRNTDTWSLCRKFFDVKEESDEVFTKLIGLPETIWLAVAVMGYRKEQWAFTFRFVPVWHGS